MNCVYNNSLHVRISVEKTLLTVDAQAYWLVLPKALHCVMRHTQRCAHTHTRITKCWLSTRTGASQNGKHLWVFELTRRVDRLGPRHDYIGLLMEFGLLTTLRQTKPRYDQGCNVRSNVECSACPAFYTD